MSEEDKVTSYLFNGLEDMIDSFYIRRLPKQVLVDCFFLPPIKHKAAMDILL